MQYPRNNVRRHPDYQDHVHTAARAESCGNAYRCACGMPAITMPENTADCKSDAMHENKQSLAMAYVPYQEFGELYEPDMALSEGSLFRELNLPFYGQRRRMG